MAAIAQRPVSELFNGQSDIVVGYSPIANYNTATIADITDFFSVGDVVEDTTDFAGDDATIDSILNEQGAVITSSTTAGTIAFTFSMANMSAEFVKFFLNANDNSGVITPPTGSSSADYIDAKKMVGFGYTQGVLTRPVAIINGEKNKMLLMPKAQIVSSLGFEDTLMVINVTVTAENVDAPNLKTVMLIDGDIEDYASTTPYTLSASPSSLQSPILGETDKVSTKASKSSTL